MDPPAAFDRQLLNTLGPVIIRDCDRQVSTQRIGGGLAIIDYGPPKPIPEELLVKLRELANSLPSATPGPKT
jgi:hypothetical protein